MHELVACSASVMEGTGLLTSQICALWPIVRIISCNLILTGVICGMPDILQGWEAGDLDIYQISGNKRLAAVLDSNFTPVMSFNLELILGVSGR